MSSNQPNKVPRAQEQTYQMKLKRRGTYMKIIADKKQAMLLQRRTKELQLQKAKSVDSSPTKRIKPYCNPSSSKQVALTIREPSAANIHDAGSAYYEINTSASSSNKGKQILQPFCVYESGSTSNTYMGQQNVTPEVVRNRESTYYEINTLTGSSNKGKQVFQPFCVFEKGTTSKTYVGQQNIAYEVVRNKANAGDEGLTGTLVKFSVAPIGSLWMMFSSFSVSSLELYFGRSRHALSRGQNGYK